MTNGKAVDLFFEEAARAGYPVKMSRNGRQIHFPHNKNIHEGHLMRLIPRILEAGAHVPTLINEVAPGRPCSHKPMRLITEVVRERVEMH